MLQAGAPWYEGDDGSPLERIQASLEASRQLWRNHANMLVAMLDGVGADPEVREIWTSWTESFIDKVTGRLDDERKAGLIHPRSNSRALATVLMGATLFGMERDVRDIAAGGRPSRAITLALVELWHRSLYESTSDSDRSRERSDSGARAREPLGAHASAIDDVIE